MSILTPGFRLAALHFFVKSITGMYSNNGRVAIHVRKSIVNIKLF
jgi:hypothetical protein